MSKKKRDKKYKGSVDAIKPTVVKVSAVKRPALQQWWLDRRMVMRPALIAGGIAVFIVLVLFGLLSIVF